VRYSEIALALLAAFARFCGVVSDFKAACSFFEDSCYSNRVAVMVFFNSTKGFDIIVRSPLLSPDFENLYFLRVRCFRSGAAEPTSAKPLIEIECICSPISHQVESNLIG